MAEVCEQCGCEAPAHYGSCPTLSDEVKASLASFSKVVPLPNVAVASARQQGKSVATQRHVAMRALDDLEEDSPTFVGYIRAYIATLEGRR